MPVLLLLFMLLAPAAVSAQGVPLVIDAGTRVKTVEVERSRGTAVIALQSLEPLGAVITSDARGARMQLLGSSFEFQFLSPFFTIGERVYQLSAPVRRSARGVLVPTQFFTDFLATHFSQQLAYKEGVLTLTSAKKPAPQPAPKPAVSAAPKPQPAVSAVKPEPEPQPKPAVKSQRLVVIDAGHGGRDPGKIGANGLAEKNVTLSVATKLAGLLRERGFEVHLTRTRDTLIALADRPHIANKVKNGRPAALFVSIHANSGVGSAEGFETYFLSEARTEDERRVAEMENAAVAYEEKPVAKGPALDLLLNGLRNDYYQRASNDFAEVVQRELALFHPGRNRGVKQAGFRVLVGALMPAVLVEIGFMSNAAEVKLLGTSAFQDKVAFGISRAIGAFFNSHEHLWAEVQ